MRTLRIAALSLGILAIPATFAMAQNYAPTPGASDVHQSIGGDMPRTHDKAAVVRELNNNGIDGQPNGGRSDSYNGYYSPRG
jgi:hypothetical protein